MLATVLACLMQNKKILKQAKERAKKKALCLMLEIDLSKELKLSLLESINYPTADANVSFSPLI